MRPRPQRAARAGRRSVTQLTGWNRKRSTAELPGSHTALLTHAQPSHPVAASEEAHISLSPRVRLPLSSLTTCTPHSGLALLLRSYGRLFRNPHHALRPGSLPDRGISQASIPEWKAIQTHGLNTILLPWQEDSFPMETPGKTQVACSPSNKPACFSTRAQ